MKKSKAFTLLEIIIVIAIIGLLATLSVGYFANSRENASISIALKEMSEIKNAIRDRFYPDFALIPEDEENPAYAVKYLCLINDFSAGAEEYEQMKSFLLDHGKQESLLQWDKYNRIGWRGPYIEREVLAFDDNDTGSLTDDQWYPLVVSPYLVKNYSWFNSLSDDYVPNTDPAYNSKHDGIIGEYRIFGKQDKTLSQIVCYGINHKADSDVVRGADGNTYVCIQEYLAGECDSSPGSASGNWENFWGLDNTQIHNGNWSSAEDYISFGKDDIVMFVFGAGESVVP